MLGWLHGMHHQFLTTSSTSFASMGMPKLFLKRWDFFHVIQCIDLFFFSFFFVLYISYDVDHMKKKNHILYKIIKVLESLMSNHFHKFSWLDSEQINHDTVWKQNLTHTSNPHPRLAHMENHEWSIIMWTWAIIFWAAVKM